MDNDDQAFLNQIEQNIRSKGNEQDDARKEAEQRAHEMDRIRKASSNTAIPGVKSATGSIPTTAKPNELEGDPRYRKYFERLKKQKGIVTPPAGTPTTSGDTLATGVTRAASADSQVVGPGSIVRFDDGSIGIYKDAVSGRDYALFYFLQPDGQFNPEGVFLQCYQAKAIGTMPENYFRKLRDDNTWDRDIIVYHLSSFDHVAFLNNLAEHEERRPKNTTPASNATIPAPSAQSEPPQPKVETPPNQKIRSAQSTETPRETTPAPAEPADSSGLVRGQKFIIKFGGKKWEAVYWSADSDGTVVAHSTHGHWSLMRLDLERFKDSLELGEVVDSEILSAITQDAAAAK